MIKGLAAWVLNNYLGKYVENLNTDQLSIALSQGLVELENLPLRKDALRQYGVPVEVRAGFVGKVKLQIPVRQIRSAPWLIVIEQLYLVAGPVRLSQWDEQAEEQAALDYKLSALDALEASWRAETESAQDTGYYAMSYTSWMSYGTGLVTNIVENLQLHIKDVHIRYEDSATIPGSCFACGVTIDSLTAESCDADWLPRFVAADSATQASYKLCELTALAVYWDRVEETGMFGDLALGELAVAMANGQGGGRKLLLAPVSARARVRRNRSEHPLRSKTQPRIVCDLQLDQVAVQLADWQYVQMVGCMKGLQFIERSRRYRKWRPVATVQEDARAWWVYASGCLVHALRRNDDRDWSSALRRARENVVYVATYAQLLDNALAPLPADVKQAKDVLEVERSLDVVKSLREVAMRRVRPPAQPPPAPALAPAAPPTPARSVLVRWFPQWWGWYSTPDTATDAGQGSAHLEEEILDALVDTVENNTLLKRDAVFAQLSFTLKQGTVNLCSSVNKPEESEPLMELEFEAMTHSLEYRPRTSSHKYTVALGSVTVRDRLTRDTMFPVLVAPMSKDTLGLRLKRLGRMATNEPLFEMTYESRPFNSNAHYKLDLRTQSLDIVYNPAATEWLIDFFTRPHQAADWQLREAARHRYESVKRRTKQELMKNWEHILQGHLSDRKTWEIELDVSAPQIVLAEHFNDKNAVIVVVDFGKFHFTNKPSAKAGDATLVKQTSGVTDSDDEDAFMTPCSTPPGSEASDTDTEEPTVAAAVENVESFTDVSLHDKLYDRYTIELSELQVLVGRARDNWKYAHLKGTSALHVLDRFNISLRAERRLVYTSDPHFPSLTLAGNLPKLVVHVNEHKIEAIRTMMEAVRGGHSSPFRNQDVAVGCEEASSSNLPPREDSYGNMEGVTKEMSRLLMVQFTVDQLALEVQSRGRGVAELQVSGVKATLMKRPYDSSMSLSVHSLLLVDALQTFGPDFELLVASHKHVGMDSVSGSLRDSEPTSPTSPGSPDPGHHSGLTSPSALSQALSSLQCDVSPAVRAVSPTWAIPSPPHGASSPPPPLGFRPPTIEPLDAEALISVEVVLVAGNCPSNEGEAMQVATIQFNNLDIIANQETIVELMGFARRVFPQLKSTPRSATYPPTMAREERAGDVTPGSQPESLPLPPVARTEITFDFHRLNVLLLRAVVKDNALLGRKIATATMTEARIQATIGSDVLVQGSLGGLQVLDLTPEGVKKHQRILSLGKDPLVDCASDLLTCLNAGLYSMSQAQPAEEKRAFSFIVKRFQECADVETANITVRMASVWYTHSTRFMTELQSCATEFKQYLSNLARSIRSAATEMAMGLVHARAEALAQSLDVNSRLSTPRYGSTGDISTPKRSRRSFSQSVEQLDSGTRGANTPYALYSPSDDELADPVIRLRLDIVLDTPVVVLPRSPCSDEVLVAHLGKISVNNDMPATQDCDQEEWGGKRERYNLEIRDMNLYSLDTAGRGGLSVPGHSRECRLMRAELLYSCTDVGKPILHDTVLRLVLDREVGRSVMRQSDSLASLLLSDDVGSEFQLADTRDILSMSGSVVTPLKVSLTRRQYEQVLESVNSVLTQPSAHEGERGAAAAAASLDDIEEEDHEAGGVRSLHMDHALRTRMLHAQQQPVQAQGAAQSLTIKVLFELPVFTVELRADLGKGEQGLVDLSFRDFVVQYDRSHRYETNIQMSLRSLLMEDLLRPLDSKHRYIVVSSSVRSMPDRAGQTGCYVSKSMPDLVSYTRPVSSYPGSLPEYLESPGFTQRAARVKSTGRLHPPGGGGGEYPCTPPPSPLPAGSPTAMHRHDNLVHINVTLVDVDAPNFNTRYNGVRRTVNVDFNSLDIVANAESWVVVLDFFGIASDSDSDTDTTLTAETSAKLPDVVHNTELDVCVRSLTLVLNRPQYEIARANISQLTARLNSHRTGSTLTGRLGSMSLLDITPGCLYKERFVSSGHEALNFHLIRHSKVDAGSTLEFDAHLKLEMASVVYVHTQRFVAEITAFFREFGHLQTLIKAATQGRHVEEHQTRSTRLLLELHAGSPVLLVPLSTGSPEVLVVDLGKLTVSNGFKIAGAEGTISTPRQSASFKQSAAAAAVQTHVDCLLDVMQIELVNMDLYAGRKVPRSSTRGATLQIGDLCVNKEGPALLQEKCHLRIQVDRNLDTHLSRHVADMSVRGALSTLSGALDLRQYTLIRGLLSYNIGENLDQFYATRPSEETRRAQRSTNPASSDTSVWTTTSIHLDLSNVALRLQLNHGDDTTPEASLACINFIKSRLILETFSDRSQDVDLVSQEILITDTRFQARPMNKRSNVFPNILQPIHRRDAASDVVQAEIHHRRRKDYSKFTILLNNMRLMAVLDWWEIVRDFILENAQDPTASPTSVGQRSDLTEAAVAMASSVGIVTKYTPSAAPLEAPFELKLNVTDSQVVLVEDTSQWDTNAVILKSTTVISYRPRMADKPLSCNLNHLELFSCVLHSEEETALSIIDPVTINMEVTRRPSRGSEGVADATLSPSQDRVLEVQTQQLSVRLSYHDFLMFAAILNSLPKQTMWARSQHLIKQQPANVRSHISKLSVLGFDPRDCATALEQCNGHLDDAALWLTSNAKPTEKFGRGGVTDDEGQSGLSFQSIELKAGHVSACIIDDCGDADVPLLEVSLAQLTVKQSLGGAGIADCVLASDYFNRVLSGWEPFVEPWRCKLGWDHGLGGALSRNRLQLHISSDEMIRLNLTSTLIELYDSVKKSWTQDYNTVAMEGPDSSQAARSPGYRRRSPFVPFELRNVTGARLLFRTLVSTADDALVARGNADMAEVEGVWTAVQPGETKPFTFEGRGKVRHRDTHKLRIHQVCVKVDGWRALPPVSVDKVGAFFREARPDAQNVSKVELPQARVVLEVKLLKDTAKKQVTVRSALLLANQLADTVEVKIESSASVDSRSLTVPPGGVLPIPLTHVMAPLWVRPQCKQPQYRFSKRPITWGHVTQPGQVQEEVLQCHSNTAFNYRLCSSVRRQHFPAEQAHFVWQQPGHVITLSSPVALVNLLPVEVHYSLGGAAGRVKPGAKLDMHHVDVEKVFELHVSLENYPTSGALLVPCPCSSFSARVRVADQNGRRLFLNADVKVNKGAGIVIKLYAGYWLSNKTELPLVFRQEGNPTETAGQFEEHEMARMVAPLLFSLADNDAGTTVVARIGGAFKPDGIPQWCQQFHLQPGIQLRRLRVSHHQRPDFVYVIGIEVRRGRGRYRNTSIVSLLPRYQLHNRSQYQLQFAQRCFATTLTDPHFMSTYLLAVPNCSLPFHWPRLDKDPLLCLRLADVPVSGTKSLWSGGFRIDSADSFHVNVRDLAGRAYFLRVEVVLSRATYFVVFTDASRLPAPLRIDNYSEVALCYYQSCVTSESLYSCVRAHTVVPYAWDEPTLAPHITLVAPGGAAASYDMGRTGEALHLTYENFIYIELTATFNNVREGGAVDPLDVESQQLVLSAPDNSRVVLARKQQGARSQLWRMTSEGMLQHEGSSPPREKNRESDNALVLDISGTAPQPSQYCVLSLRRPDRRRKTTQTWRFTEDGRLCCAHNNMCVQAKDGFFGLRDGYQSPTGSGSSWQMWNVVVLGPPQDICQRVNDSGVPLEQAVRSRRLRPGSGYLMVQVKMDGPTRVLEVKDIKEKELTATADERDWVHISASQRPMMLQDEATRVAPPDSRELELRLELPAGLGISLVSHLEELIFARFAGINLAFIWTADKYNLDLSVKDIQCDNQQLEAQCPVVLYVTPTAGRSSDENSAAPALYLNLDKVKRPNTNAEIYNHCIMKMKNMSLTIEERLMLKLFVFAGWSDGDDAEREDVDEIEFETQRLLSEAMSLTAKRFYFGALQLQLSQVRLSVITTAKMQYQLSELKKKLGLRLIKFEDAAVELQPFIKNNSFETGHFLVISILKHYKEELKWQAASILGSVDFLGNPLGFMQDVSEGVSGLIRDGNVVTLVKNVTHGLSNSAAKVTESLSDGLGRVILDDSHEEARHRIRRRQDGSSSDHLVAGLKGLGFGLLGGVTSVFKQSYDGAYREGVQGFISGFGKGLVGTVTKPVVGVLDLASETASAVRDSSRSSSRQLPARLRLPRCAMGPGGLLPHYTKKSAQGQEFLYAINNRDYAELFLSYEILRSGSEDLRIVVSSEYVRVFTCGTGNTCVVVQCHLRDLHHCLAVAVLNKPAAGSDSRVSETHYIELTMRVDEQNSTGQMLRPEPCRKPQVRCDSAAVAHSVTQMVNYAKRTYDERYYSLLDADGTDANEWVLLA